MTLPQLLQEAEAQVGTPAKAALGKATLTSHRFTTPGAGFSTPLSGSKAGFGTPLFQTPLHLQRYAAGGEREWTKEEWKLLDACFTDERLALGGDAEGLAAVDAVHVEDVVVRFISLLGGEAQVCTFGDAWTRYVSFPYCLVTP
jgi:hypothetical protein